MCCELYLLVLRELSKQKQINHTPHSGWWQNIVLLHSFFTFTRWLADKITLTGGYQPWHELAHIIISAPFRSLNDSFSTSSHFYSTHKHSARERFSFVLAASQVKSCLFANQIRTDSKQCKFKCPLARYAYNNTRRTEQQATFQNWNQQSRSPIAISYSYTLSKISTPKHVPSNKQLRGCESLQSPTTIQISLVPKQLSTCFTLPAKMSTMSIEPPEKKIIIIFNSAHYIMNLFGKHAE